jgi:hypothetical protein
MIRPAIGSSDWVSSTSKDVLLGTAAGRYAVKHRG